MKTKSKITLLMSLILTLWGRSLFADVTINYWLQDFTIGATTNKISTGTLFLISHGTNNIFNSGGGWASGSSSFVLGDDSLLAAVAITDGKADGALNNLAAPLGTTNAVTQFTALFVDQLSASSVSSTGSLLSGLTFGSGTGSTSYDWGSFRSSTIERWGASSTDGLISYVMPTDGATVSFYSVSADQGGDVSAALNTTSVLSIVPEPSTGALMLIGAVGLVALRRLRKV